MVDVRDGKVYIDGIQLLGAYDPEFTTSCGEVGEVTVTIKLLKENLKKEKSQSKSFYLCDVFKKMPKNSKVRVFEKNDLICDYTWVEKITLPPAVCMAHTIKITNESPECIVKSEEGWEYPDRLPLYNLFTIYIYD